MATIVYILCALTSLACAVLLLRGYRQSAARLLLWSGLFFVGLFLNNVLLIVDLRVVPQVNLAVIRLVPALIGVLLLLYGMIWESER
jgi:Family of unknown function (DUF5985)